MRLLIAEDERELAKALKTILKNTITAWTPFTMDRRRWITP